MARSVKTRPVAAVPDGAVEALAPRAAPPRRRGLDTLPEPFASWFASRGWQPHPHQLALLEAAGQGTDALLIAPTGGGKT
ncbi:MAG TPA: hypothetical protein VI390_00710, partial [Methyloceanibacter sp.]